MRINLCDTNEAEQWSLHVIVLILIYNNRGNSDLNLARTCSEKAFKWRDRRESDSDGHVTEKT